MYKVCKTQQSAERQRHIVDCMMEMLHEERFESITVQALCNRAQIPRKTFYRYFEEKDDVISAMADLIMMEYEKFSGPYREGDRRTSTRDMEKLFTFWYQNRDMLDLFDRNSLTQRLIERFIVVGCNENVGERLIARKEDDREMFHMVIKFSVCGLFALILNWRRRGYAQTPQEMAEIAVRLLTQPLYKFL